VVVEIRELALPGIYEITPKKFGDDRGFFSETYNKTVLAKGGIEADFVQDNHSMSSAVGVLRGLHFQVPPHAQDKLVRVAKGAVFDVVVDIRNGSPTLGHWIGLKLSAKAWNQIFVPKGFAHGFVTLEPGSEVIYKVSDYYAPSYERSIAYDDPDIGIKWPLEHGSLQLSKKDAEAGRLKDMQTGFSY